MSDDDDTGDWVSGLILLVSGFVGLAILNEYLKPKCPSCKKTIEGKPIWCPHCGAYLYWGS